MLAIFSQRKHLKALRNGHLTAAQKDTPSSCNHTCARTYTHTHYNWVTWLEKSETLRSCHIWRIPCERNLSVIHDLPGDRTELDVTMHAVLGNLAKVAQSQNHLFKFVFVTYSILVFLGFHKSGNCTPSVVDSEQYTKNGSDDSWSYSINTRRSHLSFPISACRLLLPSPSFICIYIRLHVIQWLFIRCQCWKQHKWTQPCLWKFPIPIGWVL